MSSATLSCIICGEVGLSEPDVQSHLFIHSEVSPSCPFCSLASVSLDELHAHIAAAHAETGRGSGAPSPTASPPPAATRPPPPLAPASCGGARDGEQVTNALSRERSSRDGDQSARDGRKRSARASTGKPPFMATQSGSGACLSSAMSVTMTVKRTAGYGGESVECHSSENRTGGSGDESVAKDQPRLEFRRTVGVDGEALAMKRSPPRRRAAPLNEQCRQGTEARGKTVGREADSPPTSARHQLAPSQGSWKSRSPSGGQKAQSSPDSTRTTDGAKTMVARAADLTQPLGENSASLQSEAQSERRRLDDGVSHSGSRVMEGSAASALHWRRNGVEDVRIECPFCGLMGSGEQQMLRHLQSFHADGMDTPQKAKLLPTDQGGEGGADGSLCPICAATLHSERELQTHVEQHFSAGDATGVLADELLAEALQDEEIARRQEEERRESEEFRRLQREHGMDGRGGFARQAQRSLQRDMERGVISPLDMHVGRTRLLRALADGRDDGATRTDGLTAALARLYGSSGGAAARDVARVWLCADVSHYRGGSGDRGWGCGYRNLQMLLSSLARLPQFQFLGLQDGARMPGIPRLQALVEEAWAQGFDPQGATNFAGKLRGTCAWIGATEVYALLTSQRVRCRVVDFHRPTGEGGGTHPLLYAWVRRYFQGGACGERVTLPAQLVVSTRLPPLYLQHHGHSRTVVGVEERRDGSASLIIFDPAHGAQTMDGLLRASAAAATLRAFRRPLGALRHHQYQVLVAETTALTDAEREARRTASQVFVAERIP